MLTLSMRTLALGAVAFIAATSSALAQSELPGGLPSSAIEDISDVIESCNGDMNEIVSLYSVEAQPLLALVETEMKKVKEEDATAQSKVDEPVVDGAYDIIEEEPEVGGVKGAVLRVLASPEWEAVLVSPSLEKISADLDLACVATDPAFLYLFDTVVENQNLQPDHPLAPIIPEAPAIMEGFYKCGGRVQPLLYFVDAQVPEILMTEGFDPSSILASPSFNDFLASGFDLGCFFGVPAVNTVMGHVLG